MKMTNKIFNQSIKNNVLTTIIIKIYRLKYKLIARIKNCLFFNLISSNKKFSKKNRYRFNNRLVSCLNF